MYKYITKCACMYTLDVYNNQTASCAARKLACTVLRFVKPPPDWDGCGALDEHLEKQVQKEGQSVWQYPVLLTLGRHCRCSKLQIDRTLKLKVFSMSTSNITKYTCNV